MSTIEDQPQPVPSGGRPIWELVIEDMRERDHIGRQRYGTPLQAFNGRDAGVDLYQELLDAVVYARQDIEERRVSTRGLRAVIADMAEHIREYGTPDPGVVGFAAEIDEWGDRLLKAAGYFRLQERERELNRQLSSCFTREAVIGILEAMDHDHWASEAAHATRKEDWHDFVKREVDGWFELVRRGHVHVEPRGAHGDEQP